MQQARILGDYIKSLANAQNITNTELSELLDCESYQVTALMQGRMLLDFNQLNKLAQKFNVPVSNLIYGDPEKYNQDMNKKIPFSNPNNRELILDLIDDYLDVVDAAR